MVNVNRRSFVLGAASAGLSKIAPLRAQTATWHDDNRTMRGLNVLQPFGWVVSSGGSYAFRPYADGRAFDSIMTLERRTMIRSLDFDFVRMTIDFGPLLSAQDDATLDRLIDEIMNGVDRYLESDLKVLMVNFPPADETLWPTILDGVAGPAFRRFVSVWERFGGVISARTDPARVAVEPYNEPPLPAKITADPWPVQQKYLFDRVRAVLSAHTIVVTGDSFSAIDRLAELNPKDYDANTIFKFCGYEPLPASQQGDGYWKYIRRLTFPPQQHPGARARAIQDFIAAVNADGSLSMIAKARSIREFTSSGSPHGLDTYFDKPCDELFVAARIKVVTDWAKAHGISSQRLIVGEFGGRGDFESRAADGSTVTVEAGSPSTQANFYRAWRVSSEAAGLGAWCAHELTGPDGWGLSLGKPPWTFRPDLAAALGLKN